MESESTPPRHRTRTSSRGSVQSTPFFSEDLTPGPSIGSVVSSDVSGVGGSSGTGSRVVNRSFRENSELNGFSGIMRGGASYTGIISLIFGNVFFGIILVSSALVSWAYVVMIPFMIIIDTAVLYSIHYKEAIISVKQLHYFKLFYGLTFFLTFFVLVGGPALVVIASTVVFLPVAITLGLALTTPVIAISGEAIFVVISTLVGSPRIKIRTDGRGEGDEEGEFQELVQELIPVHMVYEVFSTGTQAVNQLMAVLPI